MKPRIYTIATSHLDTSWNWTLEKTLEEYLPKTAFENFPLFEEYPEYKFSFEGAYRYELLEEYYPLYFNRIKEYIEKGRWFPAGSAWENGDVNIPSPEALFRNFLYGNRYFKEKFGVTSKDVFLPDCFGFGWALPSVAHHANLLGFTTQKLTWSSYCSVPFDIGKWYGVDGSFVYASFDTRGYQKVFKKSVRENYMAYTKLRSNIKKYNLPLTAIFHGVGDRGGAPKEQSVKTVISEINENQNKKTDVVSAFSDEIFRDIDVLLSQEQKKLIPEYDGELISTNHGAGGYTSRTMSKRLNRHNEMLIESAERLCLAAMLLCGRRYNEKMLDTCWKRVIAHQFHDDITGTSIIDCYKRNWNDYFLSLAQAAEELRDSVGAIAQLVDTSNFKGMPIAVCNALQFERTQCVYLELSVPGAQSLRVFDHNSNELMSTVTKTEGSSFLIRFEASVKPLSVTLFDIREASEPCKLQSPLKVSKTHLENDNIKVLIDQNGDISSIYDKKLNKELLKKPLAFALFDYEGCYGYAAWEMVYEQISVPAQRRTFLEGIEITENGKAAATLKITKSCGDSLFTQYVTLTASGKCVNVFNEVDWRCPRTLLKLEFPFTAANENAIYDLGLGIIERPNNTKRRFEVPAQMWAAIQDKSGELMAYALSDSRIGWDKPDDNTLRLTCMHTPRHWYRKESAQHLLDFGLNRFSFCVGAVKSDEIGEIQKNALCFCSPLSAFSSSIHIGEREGFASLISDLDERVLLRALKKAQSCDEIAVRFNEGCALERKDVSFALDRPIISAYEAYASEEKISPAKVVDGKLVFSIRKFGVKTFILKTEQAKKKDRGSKSIKLPYNADILSNNEKRREDSRLGGRTLPYELFPDKVISGGTEFYLSKGEKNALLCGGEEIEIPKGSNAVYILASSVKGDRQAVFKVGEEKTVITVSDMFENYGAWDMYAQFETGYVKHDVPAHIFTHTHCTKKDIMGQNAYIFKYLIDTKDFDKISLPNDGNIVVFAASAVEENAPAKALTPLYDALEKRKCSFTRSSGEDAADGITNLQRRKARFNFIKGYASRQLKREKDKFF